MDLMDNSTIYEVMTTEGAWNVTTEAAVPASCDEVDTYLIVPRFWLAVVVGIFISVVSIIFNTFIFAVFITSRQHRNSYNLYLLLLAFFDVFISISYIMVLSVRLIFVHTYSIALKNLWVSYMVPGLTISHVAMTTSTLLIVFAALERYCITVNSSAVPFLQEKRKYLVASAVLLGVLTKGTMLLEVQVDRRPECKDHIAEYNIGVGQILRDYPNLMGIIRFYVRNIGLNLVIFFALFVLNASLVHRLLKSNRTVRKLQHVEEKQSVKQKKARILAATRTLVIIVCTYLMSNVLMVIVTIWEYIDSGSLFDQYLMLYVLSVDVGSLLTVFACLLRLPIYLMCQPLLRAEMGQFIAQLWTRKRMARKLTIIERQTHRVPDEHLINENDSHPSSTNSPIEFV